MPFTRGPDPRLVIDCRRSFEWKSGHGSAPCVTFVANAAENRPVFLDETLEIHHSGGIHGTTQGKNEIQHPRFFTNGHTLGISFRSR
jgi:hypothetical protein